MKILRKSLLESSRPSLMLSKKVELFPEHLEVAAAKCLRK
jgi:hypothetical protein